MVRSVVSPGGSFRVHFSEVGPNAVATADADGDGTPDAVEVVATTYDEAGAFYAGELRMRTPVSDEIVGDGDGGDALFDVYLVDFAGRADGAYRNEACNAAGACAGYMIQENDFTGYAYPSYPAYEDDVYVERPSGERSDGYWYYCESAKGYYPHVEQCPEDWIKVPPQ
jgi:hypothetical protein